MLGRFALVVLFASGAAVPVAAAGPPDHVSMERVIVVLEEGVDATGFARTERSEHGAAVSFVYDEVLNAFAAPGGYIYVNRGLIERSATLSELAGVIGHEIGHVTQRHSMKQMQKAQQANVGLTLGCLLAPAVCQNGGTGALVQLGGGALFAKFSRDDEREADSVGFDYVLRAGIDPRGIPAMFRTLLAERQRRPDALEGMFGTHPLAEDRVADTEAIIAQIDPVILQSLTRDTPAFQRFKARVRSLPPSPTGTP